MHNLGLTAVQRLEWFQALKDTCYAYTEVEVWDLDGGFVETLDPVDGQIDVDATQPVTRSGSLTLYDPGERLAGLEALHYQLHLRYQVYVPALGVVSCPIGTGPVSAPPSRSKSEVTVQFQDPSMVLALGCYPKTYPKNTYAQTIRQILKDSGFPGPFLGDGFSSKKRHHHKVTVGWEDKVQRLTQIGKLADDAGFQFYCNADGHPVLRTQPKHPNNVIGSLDGLVTVDPTTTVAGTLVNRVQVAGKKPAFQGAESAAAPHPLAPALLAYYGVPRYYNEEDTSNHAKSDKAAREKAGRILTHRLHALKEAQAASIAPLPNLDPLDVLLIGADRWIADQFSIPVAGGEMTVGYNAVINRPHIRRVPATAVPKRHHHKHKAKGGKGK